MRSVNNAGFGVEGSIETVPPHEVRRMFETNVFGSARMIQALLPGMQRAAGTTITTQLITNAYGVMTGATWGQFNQPYTMFTGFDPLSIGTQLGASVGGIVGGLIRSAGRQRDRRLRSQRCQRHPVVRDQHQPYRDLAAPAARAANTAPPAYSARRASICAAIRPVSIKQA